MLCPKEQVKAERIERQNKDFDCQPLHELGNAGAVRPDLRWPSAFEQAHQERQQDRKEQDNQCAAQALPGGFARCFHVSIPSSPAARWA
jgi:hypothetical protein